MADVVANGVRFNVARLGTAREDNHTIVMLHGMVMDNLSSFYFTLANPAALDHEVILYDQRGHGRSERPPSGYSVADSVADLGAILDALDIDRPVVLLGNSYGGTVALEFALRHPARVAGVVLIEAHVAVDGWGDHMAGSLAFAAFGLDDDVAKVPVTTEADLRGLTVPVLALYGEHSDLLDRAATLAASVPDCELHVMADFTHSLLMEATTEIKAALAAFVSRLPFGGGSPTDQQPVAGAAS